MTARMFYNLCASEAVRARFSRSTLVLAACGTGLVAMSTLGTVQQEVTKYKAGSTTLQQASTYLLGVAFLMTLFAALFGALSVSSEYKSRRTGLTFLTCSSRPTVLMAKALVSAVTGALYGVVCVAVTAAISLAAWPASHGHLPFGAAQWELAGLLVLLCALAGPWGVGVGALVPSQLASVLGLVIYTAILEAAVLNYFPLVGRWLPGGAQAAIMSDPSVPQRLSVLVGVLLWGGWLVAMAVAGTARYQRHEA